MRARRVVIDLGERREALAPATHMVRVLATGVGTTLVQERTGLVMISLSTGETVEIRVRLVPRTAVLEEARRFYEERGESVPDYLK